MKSFEIVNHGEDHPDYFQGCGVSHTRFDHVATGCGSNAVEAYHDAVEQIAMAGHETAHLPTRPRGINKRQKASGEMYCYVSIRYNEPTTCVAFRVFPEGDVIALFPKMKERNGLIGSYMHIGQHGQASPELIKELRKATPEESEPLKKELQRVGYRL